MAFSFHSNAPLPRGFSVYQPALGAQLQFFPSLGSQELDDMVNAFIPGPASIKEKRATISLDFLEHTHLTGQTFKFYSVPLSASALSPVTSNSSFNTSPTNASSPWDLSITTSGSASVSPLPSSTLSQRQPKYTRSSHSRPPTDFSNLPGMKIMTKDGLDVTNSASRGSKTKEQRDHAHLMRIIKACDNCRRKKIRCDPSHKKRPVSQTQSPQPTSKPPKKARTEPQKPTTTGIPPVDDALRISESASLFEPTFSFTSLDALELLDGAAQPCDPWEEFVQYPPVDVDENYDFFLDPEGYLSSQSPSSSSLSESTQKSLTPSSQQDILAIPGGLEGWTLDGVDGSPQFPYMDISGSSTSYTDFDLFSPDSSTFLDDELMLPLSSNRHLDLSQLSSESADALGFYQQPVGNGGRGRTDQTSDLGASCPPPRAQFDVESHVLDWHDSDSGPGLQPNNDGRDGVESMLAAALLSDKTITLESNTSAENVAQESLTGDGGSGRSQVERTSQSSLEDFHFRNESSSQISTAQNNTEVRQDVSEKSLAQASRSESSPQSTSRSHRGDSLQRANLSPSCPGDEGSNDSLNASILSVVFSGRVDVNMESPGGLDGRSHQPLGVAAGQESLPTDNEDLVSHGRVKQSTVPGIGDSWQEDRQRSLESGVPTAPMDPQSASLQVIETIHSPALGVIADATTSIALSAAAVVMWSILISFFHSWFLQATAGFLLTLTSFLDCFASSQGPINSSQAKVKLDEQTCQRTSGQSSKQKSGIVPTAIKGKRDLLSSLRVQKSWRLGRFGPLVMV